MRNKVIASVVIVALLAGGGWYWTRVRANKAAAQKGTQYIFATVRKGDIRSTISGTGPVASINGVLVKSNQTGTVTQLLAQDGDKVKAGQSVVILKNENLEAQLKQAQVDLQSSQANLENLLNPQATAVRAQMLKVENARLTLKQRQQDVRNLTVKAPQSGVINAVKVTAGSDIASNVLLFTIFDDTKATFTVSVPQSAAGLLTPGYPVKVTLPGFGTVTGEVRPSAGAATPGSGNRDANVPLSVALPPMPGLRPGMVGQAVIENSGLDYIIQSNGTVDSTLVEVRSQVAGTISELAVAEGDRVAANDVLLQLISESLEVQLAQAENDVKTQEQELSNLLDPANDPSGQLRQLKAKLDQAQITLATRQADVDDLQVKAPVDGQISSLLLKVGDRVTTGANLFRVADYGKMQIAISVDELDVAKTKVGQKAQITLDALPGRNYTGAVYKINPEGVFRNDIATFEVTVQVDHPQGLMAGMNSTVNIITEEKAGVLWLPAQAVTVRQGRAFVQVLEGTEVKQKDVEVGTRTSQQVEIKSGLKENEQVILTIIRPQTTTGGMGGIFGGGNRQPVQTTVPQQQGQQQPQVRQFQQGQSPGQGQQRAPGQ
ncbi:MAG TPA: efflux RND transporter periplasmic adaptor subunit [Symbiobacteriaceae bacterium]|nr:efflux RND transporter periplasmic adaptor subunit [Symbiobacteriaceae bacterium]